MSFFYKKIYWNICLVYSKVLSGFENYFLRGNFKSKRSLGKDGFLKINSKSKLNITKHRFDFLLNANESSFYANKYHKRIILSKENLNLIIKLIFDKQFCNFLTEQTGFKYSIDFFGAYQNSSIPKEDIDKPWYANHYHLDKPYSRNMLKVFIPMSEISMDDGPLELIDINQTKKYLFNKNSFENITKKYLTGKLGDVFLCKLNCCLHKAGVPNEGNKTNLIMIQLNPSRKWYFNANLYQRQFRIEPKFTTLSNRVANRISLD